jgi:ubiquinol-cytochrome c reductase cytochrome c1 subunit
MTNAMRSNQAAEWFGAPPPDLTNSVNLRGADWVYSYLLSFYADSDRPYGVNNTVFENVGMPNVLAELQGIQERVCQTTSNEDKHNNEQSDVSSCQLKVKASTGVMTQVEFEQTVRDLTNFMAYMSNPNAAASKRIGIYTILFLLLLTTLFYFLYKEYWRDIK